MLFSVPCCDSQQIFFRGSPSQHTQLSKLAIRNKLNLELVFCRIINMITLKPIRKITLKMLFSVPCCDSQQIFFVAHQANTLSYQTCNLKEVESGNCILQNHCIDNIKANPKDNSENALLYSFLRQSTDFSSWLSKLTHSAIKTFDSK